MKRTFIALLVASSMAAVSCEMVEEQIVPVFPENQELVFSESESVQELAFVANTDWTLESSAVWCQFIDENGEEHNSLQGKEGECKVKVKVTAKGQLVGDEDTKDATSIVMIMKDQKKVIASVVRNGKKFALNLLDAEGKPIALENSVIEVGYDSYLPFAVKANFPFFVKSQPKWVEFEEGPVSGSINQTVVAHAGLIGDGQIEKYPIEASDKNVIIFSDRDNKTEFKIQVKYAGMPKGTVEIESAGPRTDWTVSMDGVTYVQEGTVQGTEEGDITFENELPATVKTLNDEFDLLFLEAYEAWGMKMIGSNLDGDPEHPVDWMKVKNEKGKLTISVGAAEADRHGWILALPKGCDITAENWFEKLVINVMDPEMGTSNQVIDVEAVEPYLVAELIQAEPKAEGSQAFDVYYNDMMTGLRVDIPFEKSTDMGIISNYGTQEVYEILQEANSINIDPYLTENWDFQAWDQDDNDVSDLVMRDEDMVNIWFENALQENQFVMIVFRTGTDPWSMVPKKILVIRPNL